MFYLSQLTCPFSLQLDVDLYQCLFSSNTYWAQEPFYQVNVLLLWSRTLSSVEQYITANKECTLVQHNIWCLWCVWACETTVYGAGISPVVPEIWNLLICLYFSFLQHCINQPSPALICTINSTIQWSLVLFGHNPIEIKSYSW